MSSPSPLATAVPRVARRSAGTAAPYRQRSWVVPAGPQGPRRARRLARRQLRRWQLEEHSDIVELLVSELVTNAVTHGGGRATLSMRRWGDTVRCAVTDDSTAAPRLRPQSPDSESGRGVHLLDMLARRWGVLPRAGGKTVWFELTT